jgi:hypothetical protein
MRAGARLAQAMREKGGAQGARRAGSETRGEGGARGVGRARSETREERDAWGGRRVGRETRGEGDARGGGRVLVPALRADARPQPGCVGGRGWPPIWELASKRYPGIS